MEGIFFAENDRLFGMYHPATGYAKGHGVVVCPPLFHEYYRCHFTNRRIAAELSRKGYDVLRLDYSGTGDSRGATPERPFVTWSRDIGDALSALRRLGGYRNVSVIATRFSAALALPWQSELGRYVCWDPVLASGLYLAQIDSTNEATLAEHGSMPEADKRIHTQDDFLGTGVSRAAIERDLSQFMACLAGDGIGSLPQNSVQVSSDTDWVSAKLTQIYGHDVIKQVVAEF